MSNLHLHIDFETRSACPIKEKGLDRYAKDPSTRVLMMAWAVNEALPSVWFPHEEAFPEQLRVLLERKEIIKYAWNAEFERTIFKEVLGIDVPVEQWEDPSVMARYASIVGSLEFCGTVLGLPEEKAKLASGKKLIKLFSVPQKDGSFNDWTTHPIEWAEFVEYCRRDVMAEREIAHRLRAFRLPPREQQAWVTDQKINSRGIPVDTLFVTKASEIVDIERQRLLIEMKSLTGLENPNSVKQMLGWLKKEGYPFGSLGASLVTKARGLPTRQQIPGFCGFIYLVRQKSTNKHYIGQTERDIATRWKENVSCNDGTLLHDAIQTFGADDFEVSELDTADSPEELNDKECFYIEWYDSLESGFNMKDGGAGREPKISIPGKRGLELRQLLSKSSTAKLEALTNTTSDDGRLRRQYVFMGASRTGRWSGRSVQLQNLPRGTVKADSFHAAVNAIRAGDIEKTREFGNPLEVVGSCLRGAFRAPAGKKFVVCDLGAIENRMLGWLADCDGILDVFKNGLDPYIAFATRMFNRSYEDLKDDKEARRIAKAPTLGCGYQLSGGEEKPDKNGDIIKNGLWGYAENMGISLTQDQCHLAVEVFREEYPEVVNLWKRTESAAITALKTGEKQQVGKVSFGAVKPCKLLYITLPSGRRLHYIRPQMQLRPFFNKWKDTLTYETIIIGKTWGRKSAYGGLWVENLCQSIARDILLEGMLNAEEAGFEIVGHTHDELITLVDVNSGIGLTSLRDCMTRRPAWASDLPLDADGFEDEIYRKN